MDSPQNALGKPSLRVNRGVPSSRSVCDAFYAGAYDEILGATVDSPSFSFDDGDVAFIIGALAFAGRVEEGRALLVSWDSAAARASHSADDRCAARFFLGVAFCRGGRYGEAAVLFGENIRIARADKGALALFYMHQGLGCLRYFTGRIAHAGRHALRSLRYAYAARFQYGRLIATDLRGHALIQTGSVRAGLTLLQQAQELAIKLGLSGNAGALACTLALYTASFGTKPIAESIEELERLAASAPARDSYSTRAVKIELARQLALHGRSDSAWGLLDELASRPVPDGDRRTRVRVLLELAFVARLRFGHESALPYLAEARRLLAETDDVTLEAELITIELLDSVADEAKLERLAFLVRLSGMARARAALERHRRAEHADFPPDDMCEDRCGALVLYAAQKPPDGAEFLARAGYYGLIPSALGLLPGKRALLISPSCVLVEDHGNVRALDDVPDSTRRLLRALACGRREKADLLREVWSLGTYRPNRHDPVIHTAVSRLRAVLGTARHWIEVHDGAYAFAAGVELVELSHGSLLPPSQPPPSEIATTPPPSLSLFDDVRQLLATSAMSTAEIARKMGVSEMTAFRRLRALLDEGLIVRSGRGRSTRYSLGKASEDAS